MSYDDIEPWSVFDMEFKGTRQQVNEVYARLTQTPEWIAYTALQFYINANKGGSQCQPDMVSGWSLEDRCRRAAELRSALILRARLFIIEVCGPEAA